MSHRTRLHPDDAHLHRNLHCAVSSLRTACLNRPAEPSQFRIASPSAVLGGRFRARHLDSRSWRGPSPSKDCQEALRVPNLPPTTPHHPQWRCDCRLHEGLRAGPSSIRSALLGGPLQRGHQRPLPAMHCRPSTPAPPSQT